MSGATNLVSGASSDLVSRWFPAPRSVATLDQRSRSPDVRPSRIGGAMLSGASAVTACQRTAAIDALVVLSRIDEHV